jgi:ABC-2 type transport system ATP-binding protein
MNTVVVSSVSKKFGPVQAVDQVSFEVAPGEIFGLLGPNGAGKTTTIRMMLDIFTPDSGEIRLFGGKVTAGTKRRTGYLPEERGLYPDLRVDENILFLATLKGLAEREARRRLDGWLKRMDLYEHRKKKVEALSKGMQQKAQLIATLIHDPDLLVIDEPFSGLDPVNTRLVKDIIEEQRQAGKTIIMCTHQMFQVEALCSRIVLIHQGRAVLYGGVDEIRRRYGANTVVLRGEGDFSRLPGVARARRENGGWRLALQPGVSPQELLCCLAGERSAHIERFEVAAPTLEDIFVAVVAGRAIGEAWEQTGREYASWENNE